MKNLKISNIRQWQESDRFDVPKNVVLPLDAESDFEFNGTDHLLIPALTALYTDFLAPANDDFYTLQDGESTLLKGGFNSALYQSETNPLNQTEDLRSFLSRIQSFQVDLKPGVAFISGQKPGISELFTLNSMGPVLFVSSTEPLPDNTLLVSILEYARDLDLRLHFFPMDRDLSQGKIAVHEGEYSDILGLKGLSAQSEEIAVFRLLTLAQKTRAKIHIRNISCKTSLELIRQFRHQGLDITFDISFLNLLLNDSSILNLNSDSKVLPPLRSDTDRKACDEALLSGEADAISINHIPVISDNKRTDFESAFNGALGIEIALPALYEKSVQADDSDQMFARYVHKLSKGARQVAGFNEQEDFLIFDTTQKTRASKDLFAGSVDNCPFRDQVFRGKISGIYIKKNLILF